MTSYGADQHSKVQKLLRYREIDEEKRKLALVKDAQEAVGVKVQIEEKAKKREEVLKERKAKESENKKKTKRTRVAMAAQASLFNSNAAA